MDTPDAAAVREWATSNVGDAFDFGRFGYPAPEAGESDRLERIVRSQVAWVAVMTGRALDSTLTDANLVALAEDAVLMATQWAVAGRGNTRAVRDALSNSRLKGLRAGDYSDTRRDFAEARNAQQVHPWLDLSNAILALATPERRAELLAELGGTVRPIAVSVNAPRRRAGSSYYEA
jgi:hypothetical protein